MIENIGYYAVFVLLVVASGAFIIAAKRLNKIYLKLMLGFSGGYLIALTFLHLIPEAYTGNFEHAGYFILLGFVFQLILEFFSKGVEHGHVHLNGKHKFPLALFLSLCIHSFLEGMPVIEHHHSDLGHQHIASNSLIFGILLHKIPVTLVLVSTFINGGVSKTKTFIYLVFFALTMPLGSLSSYFFSHELESIQVDVHNVSLSIVIGILLHISTTILFESSEEHQFNLKKFLSILAGIGVYFLFA
tara:strand:- start:957 stop:1691 length:735 start_codon:yes stop_codon:yes gene_type:complete